MHDAETMGGQQIQLNCKQLPEVKFEEQQSIFIQCSMRSKQYQINLDRELKERSYAHAHLNTNQPHFEVVIGCQVQEINSPRRSANQVSTRSPWTSEGLQVPRV